MCFSDKIKNIFKRKPQTTEESDKQPDNLSVKSMEMKYENGDFIGAAKDLKNLLEEYGRRKMKNHRYKGRNFIYFLLSNKQKDLKNTGYLHWQNITDYLRLNQAKVYPYHKNNLRNAMDFFEKEVKGLFEINKPKI
ncbi:MAG: hypothetical protein GX904_02055 [Acholeplasmataceae bacterium]|nr:hypothetical protein [Acholeplasmataceae bacterium]